MRLKKSQDFTRVLPHTHRPPNPKKLKLFTMTPIHAITSTDWMLNSIMDEKVYQDINDCI